MAGGVHDRRFLAVGRRPAGGTGVGQTGLLCEGQGVHSAAEQHGRSFTVAEDPDDPGTADPGRDFVPRPGQPFGHGLGGAVLLMPTIQGFGAGQRRNPRRGENLVDESHDLAAVFRDTSWIDRLRHYLPPPSLCRFDGTDRGRARRNARDPQRLLPPTSGISTRFPGRRTCALRCSAPGVEGSRVGKTVSQQPISPAFLTGLS